MVRWCIRQTCLTLVCEVIRHRLVQVRQKFKNKNNNNNNNSNNYNSSNNNINNSNKNSEKSSRSDGFCLDANKTNTLIPPRAQQRWASRYTSQGRFVKLHAQLATFRHFTEPIKMPKRLQVSGLWLCFFVSKTISRESSSRGDFSPGCFPEASALQGW